MITRKVIISAAITLLTVASFLLGAVGWVVATESGTAWLVYHLQESAGPTFNVGSTNGTLRQGITIRDFRLTVSGDELSIDQINLRLDLLAIFQGVIDLEEFAISQAIYQRGITTTTSASTGTAEFSLPLGIRVTRGSIQTIDIIMPEGEFHADFTAFSLEVDNESFTLSSVTTEIENFQLQLAGEYRFGSTPTVTTQFEWTSNIDGLRYAGGGSAEGTLSSLSLEHALNLPVEIALTGDLLLDESPSVDVQLTWSDLAWPDIDNVESSDGEIRVSGWLDAFSYNGAGQFEVDTIAGDFSIAGSGSPRELLIDGLEITSSYGRISADGQVALDPLSWMFSIAAENIDPEFALEDWPGSLTGSAVLSGQAEPFGWALTETNVGGTLRELAVSGTGAVAFLEPETWQLNAISLLVGRNRVDFNGTLNGNQELNLGLIVNAPAIEDLLPEATGALNVNGRIGGSLATPDLQGIVSFQDLTYGDRAVQTLTIEGAATLINNAPVNLTIQASNLSANNFLAQSLMASISGTADNHSVAIDIDSEIGHGRAHANGSWSLERWGGRVDAIGLDQPQLGSWELTQPTEVSFSAEIIDVQPLCIRQRQSNICGSIGLGAGNDFVDISFSNLDLQTLQTFLPEGFALNGRIDGGISLRDPLEAAEGNVEISGGATLIQFQQDDTPPLELPLESFNIEAQLEGEQLNFDLELVGLDNANLSIDAVIDNARADNPLITANIAGDLPDVAMLSLLSPDIDDVSGKATLAMTVAGSMNSPEVQGQAQWSNGSLLVPRWGFLVENIEGNASSEDGSIVDFSATGMAGEGEIVLNGTTNLKTESWPTRLTIRGDSLQAVQTPDTAVFISPDLEINVALPAINVSGSVLIPNASVQLDEVPAQAVVPSPDTTVHGSNLQVAPRPLDISADLSVVLGDDVSYSGAGLDVQLSGDIGLTYESGRNAVATGAVTMLGNYQAYGQTLMLDQGELLFAGPLNNPGLNVRAVRVIEPITVGLQLGGTVNSPTTEIFSSPAMNEADALSYLIFGRPMSTSATEETATLEGAALSMGLRQALPAIQRAGQTLGLDELTVRTTAAETGELMAGKQLSPRVYIRYSYGLFNRIGGLLMQFRLSDRFSLETRSGDYRSMDLIYTVEAE